MVTVVPSLRCWLAFGSWSITVPGVPSRWAVSTFTLKPAVLSSSSASAWVRSTTFGTGVRLPLDRVTLMVVPTLTF
jgi:hypothetical protein